MTNNGNWLINWSKNINTVTEVSQNNEIEFEFNLLADFDFYLKDSDTLRTYRAYRIYDVELPIYINGNLIFEKFKN